MCRTHWNAYTAGLARDAKARNAAAPPAATVDPEGRPAEPTRGDAATPPEADSPTDASTVTESPAPKRKRARTTVVPAAGSQGDAA